MIGLTIKTMKHVIRGSLLHLEIRRVLSYSCTMFMLKIKIDAPFSIHGKA